MSATSSLTIADVGVELDGLGPQLAALLPPDVPLDRFRQVALAAIRQKPVLLQCNRQSLFSACLNAAQDGLMPDGREGAIVPRKGQAVWQPMVYGIIKRVKTSGSVATLSANIVYEGETFNVLLGDEDRIVHRREMPLVIDGREVAYYAIATLKDGSKEREVMTLAQVEKVRQSSSTPNEGPWVTWPAQMALKTVIRRLAKRLPVLDPADEALQRTINRVDSLYDFGTPSQQAEASDRRAEINVSVPLRPAAAASVQRAPRVTGTKTETKTPPAVTAQSLNYGERKWLAGWQAAFDKAKTTATVMAVEKSNNYQVAVSDENPAYLVDRLRSVTAAAYQRVMPPPVTAPIENAPEHAASDAASDTTTTTPETLEDVWIEGEAKMAAGD